MENPRGRGRPEMQRAGDSPLQTHITNFPSIIYPGPWVRILGLEGLGVETTGSRAQVEGSRVTLAEYLKL